MTGAPRRAAVVGTGLIGGSIGLALRRRGWHVTGRDIDAARLGRARARGVLDAVGDDPAAEITFVATPVGTAIAETRHVLGTSTGIVTDVGSVKEPIVTAVPDRRFVGGHPMAGSEQVGVEGADADLFQGAVWVLTPGAGTDDTTYLAVRSIVTTLGAEVVTIAPERHDALVAVVSHVPHLAAATLMSLAGSRAEDHRVLLRLAAGGFRDMTRIASGHPGIWPDICVENRDAIVDSLDRLIADLGQVREQVAGHDRAGLLQLLEDARTARRNLPSGVDQPDEAVILRVPIPDRPGMLAEVTALATDLGINISDIEIAHSGEGERGVLILLVERTGARSFQERLGERGFRASLRPLE